MMAISLKRYHEPEVTSDKVVLKSRRGNSELHIFEPVKLIDVNNKTTIVGPLNLEKKVQP